MAHGQHKDEPAAPAEAEPAPATAKEPAAPAPTLEQRVAKLESYIPRIEALLGGP